MCLLSHYDLYYHSCLSVAAFGSHSPHAIIAPASAGFADFLPASPIIPENAGLSNTWLRLSGLFHELSMSRSNILQSCYHISPIVSELIGHVKKRKLIPYPFTGLVMIFASPVSLLTSAFFLCFPAPVPQGSGLISVPYEALIIRENNGTAFLSIVCVRFLHFYIIYLSLFSL